MRHVNVLAIYYPSPYEYQPFHNIKVPLKYEFFSTSGVLSGLSFTFSYFRIRSKCMFGVSPFTFAISDLRSQILSKILQAVANWKIFTTKISNMLIPLIIFHSGEAKGGFSLYLCLIISSTNMLRNMIDNYILKGGILIRVS